VKGFKSRSWQALVMSMRSNTNPSLTMRWSFDIDLLIVLYAVGMSSNKNDSH